MTSQQTKPALDGENLIVMPPSGPTSESVSTFRVNSLKNGYLPIRVGSRSKAPVAAGWPLGEDPNKLFVATPEAMNTGILCTGLRIIDVDVDDPAIASMTEVLASQHLASGALRRSRKGSSRFALIYCAAKDQPAKRRIQGQHGAVEVLGAGQQLMVDGVHPDGETIEWADGRSPATVSLDDLPAITEQQVATFLERCGELIGAAAASHGNNLPQRPLLVSQAQAINTELTAGIVTEGWFEKLAPEAMHQVVELCLGAIDNTQNDPRDDWMRVVFSVAHAGVLGCPEARELALQWSMRGAAWTTESDFDKMWNSYK